MQNENVGPPIQKLLRMSTQPQWSIKLSVGSCKHRDPVHLRISPRSLSCSFQDPAVKSVVYLGLSFWWQFDKDMCLIHAPHPPAPSSFLEKDALVHSPWLKKLP